MGPLRTYALVFIAGWVLWLWLDKSAPAHPQPPGMGQTPMQGYPGFPGYRGPAQQRPLPPEPGDQSLIQELQYGVDLIKSGWYQHSFVFLWRRQSWILAGVLTALFSLAGPGIARAFSRRRRRPARRGMTLSGDDNTKED